MNQNEEYKKFTARINTPTMLDKFVPVSIDNFAERFEKIDNLANRYISVLQNHLDDIGQYKELTQTSSILNTSAEYLEAMFSDFKGRMEYFTLVFFGAVSSGKTSMICDLANTTPVELTNIISQQPHFDSETDSVLIGQGVATLHLYEILIEQSRVRLVDVPGIGGVVHDNNSLAPFVNMADCIVFLLNAANDITKDDENFLYDHVAAIRQSANNSEHSEIQEGMDKKVLVVVNKWDMINQGNPNRVTEKNFERKENWILNGDGNKFKGISGFFRNEPKVVTANTKRRDEETGEPYESEDKLFDLKLVVEQLEHILVDEGADIRLNRPRQILQREFTNIRDRLILEKTNMQLDTLSKELDKMGFKVGFALNKIKDDIKTKLDSLEQKLSNYFFMNLYAVISDWKPKVGILDGLRGAVPESIPFFGKKLEFVEQLGLGKTAMQEVLKQAWEEELSELIKQKINEKELVSIVTNDIDTLTKNIRLTFQNSLIDNLDLYKKFVQSNQSLVVRDSSIDEKLQLHQESASPIDITSAINQQIQKAVGIIEMGLMKDLINIVTIDVIIGIIAGVILTPAASLAITLWRRWSRGKKQAQSAKEELQKAVKDAAEQIASEARIKISTIVESQMSAVHDEITNIFGLESRSVSIPKEKLEKIEADLLYFQKELQQLVV